MLELRTFMRDFFVILTQPNSCFHWYRQLFEDYHVFKRPDLKPRSEKTPEAYEIDRKLSLEKKVSCFLINWYKYLEASNQHVIVTCTPIRTCLPQENVNNHKLKQNRKTQLRNIKLQKNKQLLRKAKTPMKSFFNCCQIVFQNKKLNYF